MAKRKFEPHFYVGDIVKSGFEKGVNVGSLWFPVIKLEKSCQKVLKNC